MDNFLFKIDDTSDGCYRDFGQLLLLKHWHKTTSNRWKKKIAPTLVWTINERDVDFNSLLPYQIINHFPGIGEMTTKMGFTNLLREACWIGENTRIIAPRCYNIGDQTHREDFLEDFRLTAATLLLKREAAWIHNIGQTSIKQEAIDYAIKAIGRYLKIKLNGVYPSVDRVFKGLDDEDAWAGLNSYELNIIIEESYKLSKEGFNWDNQVKWFGLSLLIIKMRKEN
jgi:hypothetical protein